MITEVFRFTYLHTLSYPMWAIRGIFLFCISPALACRISNNPSTYVLKSQYFEFSWYSYQKKSTGSKSLEARSKTYMLIPRGLQGIWLSVNSGREKPCNEFYPLRGWKNVFEGKRMIWEKVANNKSGCKAEYMSYLTVVSTQFGLVLTWRNLAKKLLFPDVLSPGGSSWVYVTSYMFIVKWSRDLNI